VIANGKVFIFNSDIVLPAIVGKGFYGGLYQAVAAVITMDFYSFNKCVDAGEFVDVLALRFDFQLRTLILR
jgi:hypothetical protein